jgi:IS5 family transposase
MCSKNKSTSQLHFLTPTIADRLVRELDRKLLEENYAKELVLYKKVLIQQKDSKNNIYSIHEPEVYCMSKGKAHKKYEYKCKASVVLTKKIGIIVEAIIKYDIHALEEILQQPSRLIGKIPKKTTVDRGYKGKQMAGSTKVNMPKPPLEKGNDYQNHKKRKHYHRKTAIDSTITHLKADHKVTRNFFKGQIGGSISFMMAVAEFNYKKMMVKLKENTLRLYLYFHKYCSSTKYEQNFSLI